MKPLVLKLSIFFSVLTIIYLILSYFGVLRNISLFTQNTLSLAENYRHKAKSNFCKDFKVVVVIYSKDPLNDKLKCTINSILDQTIKIDSVLLVNNNPNTDKYPKYLNYVATPLCINKDYGYGNKLIPPMLKEKDQNVIIIPLENKIYGNDYFETLLKKSEENPDSQILNKNNDLVLFKINNFSQDIFSRDKKTFDKDWFVNNSKNTVVLDYDDINNNLFN
tara:strand:- start:1078 stop:1740 length:663 start_codon:yes stop_codon:yes gene_type:complete